MYINGWYDPKERLPNPAYPWARVLAYTDEGTMMTLPACKAAQGYVNAWRPLPEPPKEKT